MVNIQQRRLVYDCRAISREKESGTINCELLVHQRGSWVNLPIHNADSTIQHGRQLITGYVESQTNQKFRALLTYNHTNMKRTALWHLDQDVVCSMFIDGRKKPVCEHSGFTSYCNRIQVLDSADLFLASLQQSARTPQRTRST
jgi:hypothetical protein